MTGDPDKENGTNKPPPTGRVQERSKGDTPCRSTSQNPSRWHPSWLSNTCVTRKDSELEWLARDHPETNPITIKPETASHVTERYSGVPLPSCSPPGCPLQIKSLALSAHVSPRTVHFRVLDKCPVSGPGRGPLPATLGGEERESRGKAGNKTLYRASCKVRGEEFSEPPKEAKTFTPPCWILPGKGLQSRA